MKKSILLINAPKPQSSLADQLQEAGYDVTLAANSQEGIACLKLQYFQLVIIGLAKQEDTDPFAALTCAKEIDPKIIFIFLAIDPDLDTAMQAFRAGASDFMPATCSFDELHSRIKQCLEKQDLLSQLAIALNTTDRQNEMLHQEVANSRKLEAQLKESLASSKVEKQKTEAVLATLGVGLCIRDSSFNITYQNSEHQKIFGEHIGEKCFRAFYQTDTPCTHCAAVKTGQNNCFFEKKLPTGDGIRHLSISCSKGNFGDEDLWIYVVSDITDMKQMEAENNKMRNLESLGYLAGGLAHDFNNMLTAISGNIELAGMFAGNQEKTTKFLTHAQKAADEAKNLTNQLLTFSKGGSPWKTDESITQILEETPEFVLRGSNIACTIDIAPDLWSVKTDASQMSTAIGKIIENARDYMPQGGTIMVKAENSSGPTLPNGTRDWISISISDQGSGMPEEIIDKIFDPYFTTKGMGAKKGTGLGLTIALSIIQKHHGTIEVNSNYPHQGTTFKIYLPKSDDAEDGENATEIQSDAAISKGHILLMDDEEAVLEVAQDILTYTGYTVEAVCNGEQAIEAYKKAVERGETFDAAILDLTIRGGMGGMETIKELKAIAPHFKVIVSTGYHNDPVIKDYSRYGIHGIILKPYKLEKAQQVLKKVLLGSP